ncbi:MAG: 23S rRNA (uracil(1939)-C(5))-methyltransferase RlmD [Gammaproteobacteria bacterium]|nr:23S rRNA (uracil(1939)-C(5))-methyltransferase RlmD [Gammaproteobacteria bacterium]
MSRSRKPRRLPAEPVELTIESLSHDGRGVGHIGGAGGKTVFVDGALPGERVRCRLVEKHKTYDEGVVAAVLEPSPQRVQPRCLHASVCGGCSLQHLAPEAQIAAKQQVLLDHLARIGKVMPQEILPPLRGPQWGYRTRARLGVKYVHKLQRVLVGFREKRKPQLAELTRCEVLHPIIGERITELAGLIGGLEARTRIPQIEVAIGDDAAALVFRNLDPLSEHDAALLRDYGGRSRLHIYLQPAGPDSIHLLWPERSELSYALPNHDLRLAFRPTDFTQVNRAINGAMIELALESMAVQPGDRILDLFCGLGNFTLPLARHCAHVVGVEGEVGLVHRARDNAVRNGITNAEFHVANLAEDIAPYPWLKQPFDKLLLDPPRSGAREVIPVIARLGCRRIVYVACNSSSLARDADLLVHAHGYRLVKAGVMDMFPHTAHVESIAVFEK